MNDAEKKSGAGEDLPRAKVKRREWKFPFIWVVPVVAACVAGYLVYQRAHQWGPKITIHFKNASGLRIGQTQIEYRGVPIGEVSAVELSKDRQYAAVKARLRRSAAGIAREGSVFWIVRPTVGLGNITGLGTIVRGPYIEVLPGDGKTKSSFIGAETSPAALEGNGLKIVLFSSRLGGLNPGSPVYYRGIQVGAVLHSRLSTNAATAQIEVFIQERYTNLIRDGTKFWNASGVDVKVGLFRGAEINVESLRSIVAGGIAFATPEDSKSRPAKNGTMFPLYDEPKKEWLEWSPMIWVPPE